MPHRKPLAAFLRGRTCARVTLTRASTEVGPELMEYPCVYSPCCVFTGENSAQSRDNRRESVFNTPCSSCRLLSNNYQCSMPAVPNYRFPDRVHPYLCSPRRQTDSDDRPNSGKITFPYLKQPALVSLHLFPPRRPLVPISHDRIYDYEAKSLFCGLDR